MSTGDASRGHAADHAADTDARDGVGSFMGAWGERHVVPDGAWNAGRLLDRPVVDAHRVERVGTVADLAFDPGACRVAGLLVRLGGADGPLATVRRALGDAGLRFVPADQIVALNGDVVMVDPQPLPDWAERFADMPRLGRARGLAVVTLAGRRLGALVDLLLDREGRRLIGYLVAPGGRGAAPSRARRRPWLADAEPATAGDAARAVEAQGVQAQGAVAVVPMAPLLVPAAPSVRVGRDLVLVEETGAAGAHGTPGVEGARGPGAAASPLSIPDGITTADRAGPESAPDSARWDERDQPTLPTGRAPWWQGDETPAPPAAR